MRPVWIALFLPELSLQVTHRGLIKDLPLAISDGPSNHPFVLSANDAALKSGVRREMTVASARAMCAELIVLPRAVAREQAALEQIATTVCCFTPNVSFDQQCVLLEVSSTLKLFGGLPVLVKRVRAALHGLGYVAALAAAATPLAAWLLAKARSLSIHSRGDGRGKGCEQESRLSYCLADLPLALFSWPREILNALERLAIKRISDLTALPRDGVIKRFGEQIVADIDKALGRVPDPRTWFTPPEKFFSRVELLAEVGDSAMLLFPLRRLLRELQQFLRARGAAADTLTLCLEHGSALQTALQISTSDMTRDVARWEILFRERLGKTALAAGVSAVSVEVCSWRAYTPPNASWLPDRAAQASAWHALADRLAVRLGEARVFSVNVRDDHRPECAYTQRSSQTGVQAVHGSTALLDKPRPLWLLEHPRTLTLLDGRLQYHGDVQLIAGPERIEAGWWDGAPARRDYFVARNAQGEMLWVYRDLHDRDRWCLHGLFG